MKIFGTREYILGSLGIVFSIFAVWYGVFYTKEQSGDSMFCTQDARQCPDGSYVGRVAPSCEFAACPNVQNLQKTPKETPDPQATERTLEALSTNPQTTVEVRYTDRGFNPEKITIDSGTTVFFINNSNKAFWPAHNPTVDEQALAQHGTQLPQKEAEKFNAGTAIVTGGKYQYTFNQPGTLYYYNTLATTSKAVIVIK